MQVISSKDNEKIKHIRKLKEKKYRDQANEYVIEGIKLIQEAMKEKVTIHTILVCEECVENGTIDSKMLYEIAKYPCIYVTEKVFDGISDVKNPQGILAVVQKKEAVKEINETEDLIVVLDNIQDPGNLGTILRTVDSIGLKQIIISQGTTDPYAQKVVRSTMGAIFRINIIQVQDLQKTLLQIQKKKYKIAVTSLQTQNSIYDIEFNKMAIVIGNEANGVSPQITKMADVKMKIPMLGKTESLNASVATGIVLYEYVRQKIKKNNLPK